MQRKEHYELRTLGELHSVFSAERDPAQNNLNNSRTTQTNQLLENNRRLQQPWETLCDVVRQVVSLRK